ncbi:MAG: tRNA (guanosine(37)-N1)-methyltransferase TrmD [Clostridia bacterium]|nr:tRNA (guanosine(37)-N1)-methyltransferase TrmD [Clostridia bacterium]
MRIDILTLFPEMFDSLKASLLGKATEKGALEINVINIRDFSKDKHKKCDDYTFGGGSGMLMTPQPIYDALTSIENYKKAHKVYMSPRGRVLTQAVVKEYSSYEHLIILCGHYEGVDQRIIDLLIDEELSIGDYVLTGGELPAMVVVDSVARYLPNVLGNSASVEEESFSNGYLEYPQYTRPAEFMGMKVPDVLISGHHANVERWRKEQAMQITKERRPDILK